MEASVPDFCRRRPALLENELSNDTAHFCDCWRGSRGCVAALPHFQGRSIMRLTTSPKLLLWSRGLHQLLNERTSNIGRYARVAVQKRARI